MVHERAEPEVRVDARREHVRYPEDNRVHFRAVGESGEAHEGRLHDLSEAGLCLIASEEIGVGTRLCLGIFFEHRPDDPLMVLAEVRYRRRDEDDEFAMGLEFVQGTDEQRDALQSIRDYLLARYGG